MEKRCGWKGVWLLCEDIRLRRLRLKKGRYYSIKQRRGIRLPRHSVSEGHAQLRPALVNVEGAEPTWTPAGTFVAWKVVVTWEDENGQEQHQTAWYDSDAPHTLVDFNDGTVSYALQSVETVGEGTE